MTRFDARHIRVELRLALRALAADSRAVAVDHVRTALLLLTGSTAAQIAGHALKRTP